MKILDNIRKWLNNVGGYRMTTDKTSYKYPAYIVEVPAYLIGYATDCLYQVVKDEYRPMFDGSKELQ